MTRFIALSATLATLFAAPGAAKERLAGPPPQEIQKLFSCRTIADAAQRLACFDRETASIERSVANRDLAIVDRGRVTEARKSLFGFSVPSFGGLFGGGDEEEVKQIEGVVASVARNADGGWVIRLADKSTWSQTDDSPLGVFPKAGHKVVVRRGALGSFRLSVNGQPGFKVKRVG